MSALTTPGESASVINKLISQCRKNLGIKLWAIRPLVQLCYQCQQERILATPAPSFWISQGEVRRCRDGAGGATHSDFENYSSKTMCNVKKAVFILQSMSEAIHYVTERSWLYHTYSNFIVIEEGQQHYHLSVQNLCYVILTQFNISSSFTKFCNSYWNQAVKAFVRYLYGNKSGLDIYKSGQTISSPQALVT